MNANELDALYMAEGLEYYDTVQGIREACRTFSMSRYEYAHRYCIERYQGRGVIYSSTSTNGTLKVPA